MKFIYNGKFNATLFFFALIIFCFSCSKQKKQSKAGEIAIKNKSEKRIDNLTLKYTSGIRSILEDSKGNIWFGSHLEGLAKLDTNGLTYYTKENGLSDMQIRTIYEDMNGAIWFEGGKGLSVFVENKISEHTKRNFDSINTWKPINNSLWFKGDKATGYNELEKGPGVYQYNGQEISFRAFPISPKEGEENYYSITTPFVKSKTGTFWFGTYGAAIAYTGTEFKIIDNDFIGLNKETGFLHIRSLIEDSKGNIWIGNNGIGVFKYDGKELINFTEQHTLKQKNTKGNSLDRVFAIKEDTLGNIWFGTAESGVWKYDGNSFTNYSKENGLESNQIWTIYLATNGELWFGGANPSGVYVFNGTSFERKF
ncbi:ligand-binding sensor domain-containing protein [Kordia zhangzhouensis]|uniref:ligand-binding sensor domain-containing protein n=1 Tax=Kordia zhangzhouensis TaxID=1620405 RepID=UPI00069AAAB4|nr:two-component regulator propeller domain-containing protein [Kordia zhangzhouensis]